jgi:hypothetical protein
MMRFCSAMRNRVPLQSIFLGQIIYFVNNKMLGKVMLLPGVILNFGLCIPVHGKDSNNPPELGWDSSSVPKLKIR